MHNPGRRAFMAGLILLLLTSSLLAWSVWSRPRNGGLLAVVGLPRADRPGLGAAGLLDGNPKQLLPDLYYLGEFSGESVYGFFSASRFYLVNAPGGPGLAAFLNDRLKQLGLKPEAPAAVLLTSVGQETAGLEELVATWNPQVVAARAGVEAVRRACPAGTAVLAAEDLPRRNWFPVTPLPLKGRGLARVAYAVPWTGKTVLFSGKLPVRLDSEDGMKRFSEFLNGRGSVADYLDSLAALEPLNPDLWLPAIPAHGQNAHLDGQDWRKLVEDNRAGIKINTWEFSQIKN